MDDNTKSPDKLEEIDIFYQKAPDYRVVSVDGAWASLTPQLSIQIAFHNELQPMPSRVRHKVVDGNVADELEKDVEKGLIRETAVTVVVNPMLAVQLIQLLQTMIDRIKPRLPEEAQKELDKVRPVLTSNSLQGPS